MTHFLNKNYAKIGAVTCPPDIDLKHDHSVTMLRQSGVAITWSSSGMGVLSIGKTQKPFVHMSKVSTISLLYVDLIQPEVDISITIK